MDELETIKLPEPKFIGKISVEEALRKRRSVRVYRDEPLTLEEISQLLWAAQGITDPEGLRTAPSAGALYPIETYIFVGKVRDLPVGVYKYKLHGHALVKIIEGDRRSELKSAAIDQESVGDGAVVLVFSAEYGRTTWRYGERGIRYVHIEVGHVAQNICLQAVSARLGTVVVGAFHDKEVRKITNMTEEETPLLIMPVGRK